MGQSKEIKNVFFKGKQNRDNDPRLIPEGEYQSLLNGRIARSEGSGVGAIENVRGNVALSNFVDDSAVVIGSIRQQSENRIFYFIAGSTEDAIYEFREDEPAVTQIRVVLRSTSRSGVLKFNVANIITGINILGEGDETLLFWTDGLNPPRRINVERMITRHRSLLDGVITDSDGEVTLTGFTEEEISVVKRPPNEPPLIDIVEVDDLNPDNDDELDQLREENLKEKFVRFAYRWKYIDDEYSVFSPFSEVPFSAGRFSFDRTTGAITSMENLVRSLKISLNTGPRDVVEVDLLYRADDSPAVYVVESFVKDDPDLQWRDNILLSDLNVEVGRNELPIDFSSNKLYRVLPDSEVNATFHNTPLTAKAQEIVQNRVVYGNYTDRYNIEDLLTTYRITDGMREEAGTVASPITIDLDVDLANNALNTITTDTDPDLIGSFGEKNLKSDRDYELGIVYFDSVGRSTPVLTSPNNSIHVPVQRANRRNRIQVTVNNKAPHWATHYRFFVKTNRTNHFNIIPLDSITQPDDNEYKWFRISSTDASKVNEGDYLNLKINDNSFTYLDGKDIQTFRVEEVGIQERNFLELETPRVGIEMSSDGEILNEGAVITLQKPGVWMRLRNMNILGRDIDAVADSSVTRARSNNARDLDNDPIVGAIENYQDTPYYYRGSNINNAEIDVTSVTFAGTYTPGTGYNTGAPAFSPETTFEFGPTLTDTDSSPGPMRIKVVIQEDTKYTVEFYTSESADSPQVVRQLVTLTALDLPTSGTTVQLLNGASITFNEDPADYNIGDAFVCTWRLASNFMWRCWRKSGVANSNRYAGPNDTSRRAINARRSHILVGAGQVENGINGNSLIQLGIDDGLNNVGKDNLDGDPISLQFSSNEFYTNDVFYDNLEEWIFEEGLYTRGATSTKNFSGTDRDGDDFGIHQLGFWRGLPTIPGKEFGLGDLVRWGGGAAGVTAGLFVTSAATGGLAIPIIAALIVVNFLVGLFTKNKEISKDLRIASGPRSELIFANGAMPLYMMIQSGSYNDSSNNMKADHRMSSQFAFVQGTGASENDLSTVPICFETIPSETAIEDIAFFEISQTYKCENGVHYGLDPNNHQLVNTVSTTAAGTETSEVTKPVVISLDYSNCVAFDNGIECSSIRDEVGRPFIAQGAKASTVVQNFEQEDNIATLIYSGVFNSSTGVNDTNVFSSNDVANRTILKELDTNFGSIQKLYAENRILYAYQEDKVSGVQVNRRTLFNADGDDNVASSNLFLNETLPISGEYGISKNPESFAVYGPDKFWSDKSRGVILNLRGDQITEISEAGMRDFFRDQLAASDVVIGSYDDYHDQYIVTMRNFFQDPVTNFANQPLFISRQGFLSRSEACRFPESRLQFREVYEFYFTSSDGSVTEEPGFQLGDIIYYDVDRTSVFNGDDDWFVWFDRRRNVLINLVTPLLNLGTSLNPIFQAGFTVGFAAGDAVGLIEELQRDQVITVQGITSGTVYPAVVGVANVAGRQLSVTFNTGVTIDPVDISGGSFNFRLNVDLKYVINVDSFGTVRRKLNCVGIQPLNHDAFRASLQGYQSPQEACGNGIVGRILYHNGDDATPDRGDYIYDSPYASDEYVEVYTNWLDTFPYSIGDRVVDGDITYEAGFPVPIGIQPSTDTTNVYWTATTIPTQYKKGRTQRSGWYQIFDGSDFADYVIFIVQGTVVTKIACSSIIANRNRILVGDRFVQATSENDDQFAAQVCRQLPGEERFHDGDNPLPVIGDTVYLNNFTTATLQAGSYSLSNGSYMTVNSSGTVNFIRQCIIRTCVRDLINTYASNNGLIQAQQTVNESLGTLGFVNEQLSTTGVFRFRGIVDEDIYGNTDRQVAARATVRWAAHGAERYPSNPNDFYEMSFPNDGVLSPNTQFTLTNADFVRDSAGETQLEYTILELCYDRNLVPQNITFRYYTPSNLSIVDYPTANASTALARIFDLTGNTGTGTVEVTEQIFYDRTASNRIYYTDEDLTPLDGTNGGSTPLWWAFGDADNTAATQACRISSTGALLECRDRAHPFEFDLLYHSTTFLSACNSTATPVTFLTDMGDPSRISRDFEDVTSMRTLTGGIPPTGYYVHEEQDGTATTDDDQKIARFWDSGTETFLNVFPANTDMTTNNCPIPLPGVSIRFSTSEQTAVCGSGSVGTYYLSDSGAFAAKTVFVYSDEFGIDLVEAGWFGPDTNGLTWSWNGVNTLTQEHTACAQVCSDPDASNTGSTGDCTYPTVCTNSNAANFVANPNPKFNVSTEAPTCDFRSRGCTNSSATNYDSNAQVDDGSCTFCADLTGLEAGGSRTCVGNDLHSRRFTGTGTGTNCATESYVVQLNSPDCVFSCPAAGTVVSGTRGCGTGANIGNLVETRYTGATPGSATQNSDCTTEVVVVTASDPSCGVSGCTNSGAANYNSMATSDDGSCYIVLFSGNEGNSSTNACASTTAEILYSTVGGTTAFTDTALTSRFTGFISDGTNFRPYNNGVLDRIGTCQAPSRFTGATVTVDRETSINTTFTISFSWTGVNLPRVIYWRVTGTGLTDTNGQFVGSTFTAQSSTATGAGPVSASFQARFADTDGVLDGNILFATNADGTGVTQSVEFDQPISDR